MPQMGQFPYEVLSENQFRMEDLVGVIPHCQAVVGSRVSSMPALPGAEAEGRTWRRLLRCLRLPSCMLANERLRSTGCGAGCFSLL
jgi:hypothetical protein